MSDSRMSTHERRALFNRAFEQVIESYTDLQTNGGGSVLPRGVKPGSKTVVPSTCDFICDVEIAARRTQFGHLFEDLYKTGKRDIDDMPDELMDRLKQRLGQLFIARRIFPTHQYFKGKAVTR